MKKLIIALIIIAFVVGGTYVGIRIYKRHKQNSNPVNVYSLEEYGDSSWYEDDSSSMSGSISSSGNQKIYLDSSKQIKEIYVKQGDKVKAGQELLKYDDTQARLNIESMYTDLEVTKSELAQAYNELDKLKKKKPVEKTTQKKTEATTQKKTEATTQEPTASPSPSITPSPSPTPEISTATSTDAQESTSNKTTEATTEKKKKKKKKKTTEETTSTTEATTQNDIPYDKDSGKDDDSDDADDEEDDDDEEYTEYELSLAITRQNEEIKSIQNDIDNQNLAIKKAERNLDSQAVVAKVSGTVSKLITADESRASGTPLMVIDGAGSYIATVSVGEYELASLSIGTEVSVYCYDTGNRYPGTIVSIGINPVGESSSSFIQSYYPVKVSIEPNDDLSDGSYVEVSVDKTTASSDDPDAGDDIASVTDADFSEYVDMPEDKAGDIVIPLFFVKKEGNRYYVMKAHNGRLKKQYINTGKIYYGTEISVTGGISSSDWIAFPYDKNATEGKVCREADSEDLY